MTKKNTEPIKKVEKVASQMSHKSSEKIVPQKKQSKQSLNAQNEHQSDLLKVASVKIETSQMEMPQL